MKSLNLGHPLVIVTLGVPGSGKSFFARQFAETFHVPLVSHDAIRATLFSRPTYDTRQEAVVAKVAALFYPQLFASGSSFIIDGGMNAATARSRLRALAKQHHYETMIIWPQLDHNDAFFRLEHLNDKRPDDHPSPAPTREQFDGMLSRFNTPHPQAEAYIVISGKHTFATQAKVVLKKLTATRERPAPLKSRQITATEARPVRKAVRVQG